MIKLWFKKILDPELEIKIPKRIYLIRLYADVIFKTPSGWTNPYPAIIDTGAPVTVIPLDLWKKCEINILGNHWIKGIVPKKRMCIGSKYW